MPLASDFSLTRVINPCALITVDGVSVLTDPYFRGRRWLPMTEAIGVGVKDLPHISAVLGGHGAFDHWQLAPLHGHLPPGTPIMVANRGMGRGATRAGFVNVQAIGDGETVPISSSVAVTAVRGDRVLGRRTSHYVIAGASGSVYVGTEAGSLDPIRRSATMRRVDVAVLPIDGLTIAGKQLVMDAATAVEAAVLLGARVLAPIHFSQRPVPPLIRCRSGLGELLEAAAGRVEVRHAPTGTPIDLAAPRSEPAIVSQAQRVPSPEWHQARRAPHAGRGDPSQA